VFWFGSWVKPRLDFARVPTSLHLDITRLLIDRFVATLDPVQDQNFIVIPAAGTLSKDDWQDEIYPSRSGIKKLVPKFEQVLKKYVF
jgi:hypothetical protein